MRAGNRFSVHPHYLPSANGDTGSAVGATLAVVLNNNTVAQIELKIESGELKV
jgi:hypothetical protein